MVKCIIILLTLISIQGYSQVKQINKDDFEKLRWDKLLIYFENGNFFS